MSLVGPTRANFPKAREQTQFDPISQYSPHKNLEAFK